MIATKNDVALGLLIYTKGYKESESVESILYNNKAAIYKDKDTIVTFSNHDIIMYDKGVPTILNKHDGDVLETISSKCGIVIKPKIYNFIKKVCNQHP